MLQKYQIAATSQGKTHYDFFYVKTMWANFVFNLFKNGKLESREENK